MSRWSDDDLARLRCLSLTHTMREAADELGRIAATYTPQLRGRKERERETA